jgi:hypothetical protein
MAGLASNLTAQSKSALTVSDSPERWKRLSVALAKEVETDWVRVQKRLTPVASWAQRHLGDRLFSNAVVFYPFGGPDVPYVLSMFPDSQEYVLVGLEEPGTTAAAEQALTGESLAVLRRLFHSYSLIGFYRTEDLRLALKPNGGLQGVVPLLLVPLAATGYLVWDVTEVSAVEFGRHQDRVDRSGKAAVSVVFSGKDSRIRRIMYLRADLADRAIRREEWVFKYLEKRPTVVTFIKCGSYLLHKNYFSIVREAILKQSHAIVQDDSGIPYRFLVGGEWDIRIYGKYTRPIALFENWYQPDLEYAVEGQASGPLPFAFGYKGYAAGSVLMVARRRSGLNALETLEAGRVRGDVTLEDKGEGRSSAAAPRGTRVW